MCALLRATAVTTVYQRDSSSKRPRSSVVSAARAPTKSLRKLPKLWTLGERAHSFLENIERFPQLPQPFFRELTRVIPYQASSPCESQTRPARGGICDVRSQNAFILQAEPLLFAAGTR